MLLKRIILLLLTWLLFFQTLEGQSWKQYPYRPPGSFISFPEDEGRHPNEPSEWWYMSGSLRGQESGIPYSFMLSYFYLPALGYDGFRILNLCRDDTGEFYSDVQGLYYTKLGEDSLHIEASLMTDSSEWWYNKVDNLGNLLPFEYEIKATGTKGSVNLLASSNKTPLILGDSGLFDQGAYSYTYYYSLTDNEIQGNITFNGISEEVSGKAWIDKQYGNFSPATEETYEWFSVNLSNGMDFVLWDIFTPYNYLPDQSSHRHISLYVDSITQLTFHDFELERLKWAYTPDNAVCYAQQWHLRSPVKQMDLVITTLNNHGDVTLPFRFYEGATTVTGTVNGQSVTGRGFTELVKSYEAPDPVFIQPRGGSWKDSLTIAWNLQNPDDGYALLYDLEYSLDKGSSFAYITQGIRDNRYVWDDFSGLSYGDSCWIRLTAYTPDLTLSGKTKSAHPSIYKPNTTTSGLLPHEIRGDYRIYPVPAKDFLVIQSGEKAEPYSFEIYDLSGKLLLSGKVNDSESPKRIPLSGFKPASYYIMIKPLETSPRTIQFLKVQDSR